jgi:hypothetical protein
LPVAKTKTRDKNAFSGPLLRREVQHSCPQRSGFQPIREFTLNGIKLHVRMLQQKTPAFALNQP